MKRFTAKTAVLNAAVAALYFALTFFTQPIAFSSVFQLRIGEALTILPFVFPDCYIGLAVGCALANLQSPFGLLDVILGSLITLIAAFITSKIKNVWLSPLPPIILNAAFLPLIWSLCGAEVIYITNMLSLLASQTIVLYALGVPLAIFTKKKLSRFINFK